MKFNPKAFRTVLADYRAYLSGVAVSPEEFAALIRWRVENRYFLNFLHLDHPTYKHRPTIEHMGKPVVLDADLAPGERARLEVR